MNDQNEYFRYIHRDPETAYWKVRARQGERVEAIKDFRASYGCGLVEAKDVVEAYLEVERLEDLRQLETTSPKLSEIMLNDGRYLTLMPRSNGKVLVQLNRHVITIGEYDKGSDELLQAIADIAQNAA